MTLTLTSLWRSVGSRSSWRRWGRTWSSTISCWRQLWWSSSTRTTPTLLTSPPTWSVDINVAHQPLWLFKLQQYLIYFSWFILYIVLFYVFIIDKKIEMSITFIVQIILITRFFCSTVSQNICLCYVKKRISVNCYPVCVLKYQYQPQPQMFSTVGLLICSRKMKGTHTAQFSFLKVNLIVWG